MKKYSILIIIIILAGGYFVWRQFLQDDLKGGETMEKTIKVEENGVETEKTIFETDGVKHSVPLEEIVGGGPAKDGIPSIDNPKFISIKEAQEFLGDEELVLEEEKKIENDDKKSIRNEKLELKDEGEVLNELSKLEDEFKVNIISSPMKNITKRDLAKGFVGAFVGVMSHFAFVEAAHVATTLNFIQSTVLYLVAFLIIVLMLYYSGFRNIEKHIIVKFMPLRAVVLYSVSVFTILFVNLLFGKFHFPFHFIDIYNLVGASIILAVMGAGTADLLGKGE